MKKALESAASTSTVLIGDDTDLLVLLIFHADLNSHDIFFASERKNAKNRVWNIKEVKSGLGPFVCKHVLFLHGFSGCDTFLTIHTPHQHKLIKRERKLWWLFTVEKD